MTVSRLGPVMTTKDTENLEITASSGSGDSSLTSCKDSNQSNFYANQPMSVDSILKDTTVLSFVQILNMFMFKSPVIINAFFISLAGYYRIESFDESQAVIKGIGLGNIIINILCFGVAMGLNSSLETLVAYSYGCSLNHRETESFRIEMRRNCGQYLNLARLVTSVFMVFPTTILMLFAEEILIGFFKQNAFVSEIAI